MNLKATKSKDSGIWMSTIAINAQTSNFHSEDDVTYTIVKVPNQCKIMNKGNTRRMFLVRINSQNTFAIPLVHNISFYSAVILSLTVNTAIVSAIMMAVCSTI